MHRFVPPIAVAPILDCPLAVSFTAPEPPPSRAMELATALAAGAWPKGFEGAVDGPGRSTFTRSRFNRTRPSGSTSPSRSMCRKVDRTFEKRFREAYPRINPDARDSSLAALDWLELEALKAED